MFIKFYFFIFILISPLVTVADDGHRFRIFLSQLISLSDPITETEFSNFEIEEIDDFIKRNEEILLQKNWHQEILAKDLGSKSLNKKMEEVLQLSRENRSIKLNKLLVDNLDLVDQLVDPNSLNELLVQSNLDKIFFETGLPLDIINEIKIVLEKKIEFLKIKLNFVNSDNVKELISFLSSQDKGLLLSILDMQKDLSINQFERIINVKLKMVDFRSSDALSELKNTDFQIQDINMKALANKVTFDYFDKDMPIHVKRNIIAQVLLLSPQDHLIKLESTVLANTEVVFQKAMQFFISKTNNKKLKNISDKIKSSLNFCS